MFWRKATPLSQARQKHQFVQDVTDKPHNKMARLSAGFNLQILYEMCRDHNS